MGAEFHRTIIAHSAALVKGFNRISTNFPISICGRDGNPAQAAEDVAKFNWIFLDKLPKISDFFVVP